MSRAHHATMNIGLYDADRRTLMRLGTPSILALARLLYRRLNRARKGPTPFHARCLSALQSRHIPSGLCGACCDLLATNLGLLPVAEHRRPVGSESRRGRANATGGRRDGTARAPQTGTGNGHPLDHRIHEVPPRGRGLLTA